MNKKEFIDHIAEKNGFSKKDTEIMLNATLEGIEEVLLDGQKVQFQGFGTFEVKERPSRIGRNPKTLEPIEIKESKVPVFKCGKMLKDSMNK